MAQQVLNFCVTRVSQQFPDGAFGQAQKRVSLSGRMANHAPMEDLSKPLVDCRPSVPACSASFITAVAGRGYRLTAKSSAPRPTLLHALVFKLRIEVRRARAS